jgi:hypothetical protein
MLRDALSALPGFTTWPCDEINYLWRHGNARTPHDELTVEQATPRVRRYLRRQFAKQARHGAHVVEKTCANSLRVGFVDRVVPSAKFVWIVRDGRDAAASARRRWHTNLDLGYIASKARFVPPTDAPYYAAAYLARQAHRLRSPDGCLSSWGPRPRDMDRLLAERSLLKVCAVQWQRCVEKAATELAAVEPTRVHRVRYEDVVAEPESHLAEMAAFACQGAVTSSDLRHAVAHISSDKVRALRSTLDANERDQLNALVKPTLAAHGYA